MVLSGGNADKKFAKYGYGWNDNWNNYDNFYDEYMKQKGGAGGNGINYIPGMPAPNSTEPAPPAEQKKRADPVTPAAPATPAKPASAAKKDTSFLPPELLNPSKLHQKVAKTSSIDINGFKVALNDLASEDEDMDPELRS